MLGKTILHYRIVEKLGEGGMGVVYKALDTKLERFVALKFLPHELGMSAEDRARFLQEARAASAISHANVCVIHVRYPLAERSNRLGVAMMTTRRRLTRLADDLHAIDCSGPI